MLAALCLFKELRKHRLPRRARRHAFLTSKSYPQLLPPILTTAEPAVAGGWKSLPLPHAVAEGGEQRVGRGALHAAGHRLKKGRQTTGARACPAGLGRTNSNAEWAAGGRFACCKSLPLPHAVAEGGGQRVGRGPLAAAGHRFKKGRQVAGDRACTTGKSPATGRVIATGAHSSHDLQGWVLGDRRQHG